MRLPRGHAAVDVAEVLKPEVVECLARSPSCSSALVLCEPVLLLAKLFREGSEVAKLYYVVGQGSVVCPSPPGCASSYYVIEEDAWGEAVPVAEPSALAQIVRSVLSSRDPRSFCKNLLLRARQP